MQLWGYETAAGEGRHRSMTFTSQIDPFEWGVPRGSILDPLIFNLGG